MQPVEDGSLRGLVFDLDDTLVAATRARLRGNRVLRELGIDPRHWRQVSGRWWRRYQAGEITSQELRFGRFAELGLEGEAGVAADEAWRRVAFGARLRLGARRLLLEARRAGLRTAILTNGTIDPQRNKLQANGLVELVDVTIVSEEVGHHKPHPEAFRHALGRLELGAAQAGMVGDDLAADVEGALQAGFARIAWVTGAQDAGHPDERVVVVRRLDQVLPALDIGRDGRVRAAGGPLG
ncbi:MAG: HAD family hydrolase [bacterium]|jgi:HAD superfamily hydrolase (TIGR01509 family)|nr:HAD family hydrolase [bacterium]